MSCYAFPDEISDTEVIRHWKQRAAHFCKPCLELKFCPYGTLVEEYPAVYHTPPRSKEEADWLRGLLQKDDWDGAGEPYPWAWREYYEEEITRAEQACDDVEYVPKAIEDMNCREFGHMCPVYFLGEDAGETRQTRRRGRAIPTGTLLRVARRDNNQCQVCGKLLQDVEIEFDHVIPLSKGGSSEEQNLRVTCQACNRAKGSKLDLAP